jgi:hypothetical protein
MGTLFKITNVSNYIISIGYLSIATAADIKIVRIAQVF